MKKYEKKRNQKIFEVLLILKSIYLLMALVALTSTVDINKIDNPIAVAVSAIGVLLFMITYFMLVVYYHKHFVDRSNRIAKVIEIIILLFIFTTIVMFTGGNESPYKFICIFIVLISTIQFGEKHSIITALILSLELILIDFMMSPNKETLSIYFERDLVLIASLLVTAFILSMYVNIEVEYSKDLKRLANVDELTGLFNHRYLQQQLTKVIKDSEEKKENASLLFMDIDYFKNYNDINGHQHGDWVLKKIGIILKESIRENDIVARYGGEEFVAILPNTDKNTAIEIGEKIRKTVEDTYFYAQENQPDENMTISVGVSCYPENGKSKHELINAADDALYRAKFFNKNRVEAYYSVLDEVDDSLYINEKIKKSLKAFISMINKKDKYTYGHTERVVIYSKWFAEFLGLSEEEKIDIKLAAYLHDIGKVELPEELLNKRTKLTDDEFSKIKEHPVVSAELIESMKPFERLTPVVKYHHERYDGRGYPDKLEGEKIPYLSRIITIADSFDAMTSHRPYNFRKSRDEAIEELRNNAGTQFDPALVEKFISMLEKYSDKI